MGERQVGWTAPLAFETPKLLLSVTQTEEQRQLPLTAGWLRPKARRLVTLALTHQPVEQRRGKNRSQEEWKV